MKLEKISFLLFSLALCLIPFLSASATSSSVIFEGGAENFVFTPGSDWGATDLFSDLKEAMPGDILTQDIIVRNTALEYDFVRIYLRADPHDDILNPLSNEVAESGETIVTVSDFLSNLSMTVTSGETMIYNSTLENLGTLANNVLIDELSKGEESVLRIELSVPASLDNTYMHRSGEVDWIFTAEGFINGQMVPIEEAGPSHIKVANTGYLTKENVFGAIKEDIVPILILSVSLLAGISFFVIDRRKK